ncbi:NAD(P)/FAD-dependent oxidoreductase [Neptunicoccus cionae]|uniref:Cyclopropane-fatty-acyl-phospholipid synthase n=1 Tax=Neptunicoccus cionae TaxID=2035344 RepID=A0A916VLS5_9RHOB|nr:FAD-dependent oxidoreductase [Amylibacter cionae]GGA05019.1 cyclopropane-fatty-acyl-phospholipid synthase [Amylibacter cionae]
MPFEFAPVAPVKIAVIGAGVSGMGAAHLLSKIHNVTLLETETRLGGHARTVTAGKNGDQPVDTGFIVFNYANYPRLTGLFNELDVPVIKSDMSFGVSADNGRIEYALNDLAALFAQKRNIVNPLFLGMLVDIMRFNSKAVDMAADPDLTLGELMARLRLGEWFQKYYLLPFSGAIWSTPLEQMLSFPAQALTRFFKNHNLLNIYGQHQWYTVKGGSVEYVRRLELAMRQQGCEIRTGANVKAVRRNASGVEVRLEGGTWEQFDRVVFACHSDQALAMLTDPTSEESATLGAIGYQLNRAVLHADPSIMPKRKSCWASWTYTTGQQKKSDPVGITYWMNTLQSIPHDDLLLSSLNPTSAIREELIYEETSFMHPVFDRGALEAQSRIKSLQGLNNTWFCGAYLRNGFHEDGYSSAVDVANHMKLIPQWA